MKLDKTLFEKVKKAFGLDENATPTELDVKLDEKLAEESETEEVEEVEETETEEVETKEAKPKTKAVEAENTGMTTEEIEQFDSRVTALESAVLKLKSENNALKSTIEQNKVDFAKRTKSISSQLATLRAGAFADDDESGEQEAHAAAGSQLETKQTSKAIEVQSSELSALITKK